VWASAGYSTTGDSNVNEQESGVVRNHFESGMGVLRVAPSNSRPPSVLQQPSNHARIACPPKLDSLISFDSKTNLL
jgi:hypothetical protein